MKHMSLAKKISQHHQKKRRAPPGLKMPKLPDLFPFWVNPPNLEAPKITVRQPVPARMPSNNWTGTSRLQAEHILSSLCMYYFQARSFITATNDIASIKTETDASHWSSHVYQGSLANPLGCIPQSNDRVGSSSCKKSSRWL